MLMGGGITTRTVRFVDLIQFLLFFLRREKISRQVKGCAAQVNVEGHIVRSVHGGVVVEKSVLLLSLQVSSFNF